MRIWEYIKTSYVPIVIAFPEYIVAFYSDFILLFDDKYCFVGAYSISDYIITIARKNENIHYSVESKYVGLTDMLHLDGIKSTLDDAEQGYSSKYVDFDSKCIEKGQNHYYYLHAKVDGGPDRRFRDNPYTISRYDQMQYGILSFSLGDIKYTFYISSNKTINLFEEYLNFSCRKNKNSDSKKTEKDNVVLKSD